MKNIRLAYWITYVVLACMVMEDALPLISGLKTAELVEASSDLKTDDNNEKSEKESDLFKVKEKHSLSLPLFFLQYQSHRVLAADSEDIPPSHCGSVFSPPPERI